MPGKKVKHAGIRAIRQAHRKPNYAAQHEGRAINGQVPCPIQPCIRTLEKANGPIPLPLEEEEK